MVGLVAWVGWVSRIGWVGWCVRVCRGCWVGFGSARCFVWLLWLDELAGVIRLSGSVGLGGSVGWGSWVGWLGGG